MGNGSYEIIDPVGALCPVDSSIFGFASAEIGCLGLILLASRGRAFGEIVNPALENETSSFDGLPENVLSRVLRTDGDCLLVNDITGIRPLCIFKYRT